MTEALFTLTGNLGTLIGSSATRTVYAETAANISNPTDDINYAFPISKLAPSGVVSLQLPANDVVNLPYSSATAPQFGFKITVGKTVWTVPAQAVGTSHDLSEFTTPFAAPVTTDSTAVDSINSALLANAGSATRTSLDGRYATGVRGAANGVAPLDAGSKVPDANIPAVVTRDGVTRWDVLKYGVATDGVTLADTAFNALLTQMKAGDILEIPNGANIKLAARRDIAKPITIEGNGATISQASTTGVFNVTSGGSGSKFRNLKGVGPSGTTYAANSIFINVTGTVAAYVEDLKLENIVGQSWGNGTLWANFARRITTRDVFTQNSMYVGQMFLSCSDVALFNPMCDNLQGLSGSANSYPVAFTRDSNQTLANAPRSVGARVFGGWAKNTTWESLDTHAGVDIRVFGYRSFNTKIGVSFVGGTDTLGAVAYGPIDCWAYGCESSSGVSDGTAGDGFILAGSTPERATGGFVGCTAIGHGTAGNTNGSGGMRLTSTDGASVSNFRAIECSPFGVALGVDNYDAVLSDVVATDPWNSTSITGVVGIAGNNNTFTLANSRLKRGTKTATNLNTGGVYSFATNYTGVEMMLGGGNDFSLASIGPYVNVATWLRHQFFNGAKAARPTGTPVAATDLPTAIALVNSLRTSLKDGLQIIQ